MATNDFSDEFFSEDFFNLKNETKSESRANQVNVNR